MLAVRNGSEAVKVLKAAGAPILRLLPGCNLVSDDSLKLYQEGNTAAQAMFENCLSISEVGDLSADEKKEAERAKEKNDFLNKSARIIQLKDVELDNNKEVINKQAKTIDSLIKRINVLERKGK